VGDFSRSGSGAARIRGNAKTSGEGTAYDQLLEIDLVKAGGQFEK